MNFFGETEDASKMPGVFVFGANAHGVHRGGAARQAAQMGYPQGSHDSLYIPNKQFLPCTGIYGVSTKWQFWEDGDLALTSAALLKLHETVKCYPNLRFNITAVGTGLSRLSFASVAVPLVPLAVEPNVWLDERFRRHFNA